ncbi:hypothetical protein [Paenibacillus radicis (ex Gao et al. 2016)]|uniref:DUF4352 domain-containing protein n=1 Tax=Paenibacillus radicis (ex Gao et al. 2016) TaxID=1737354 RepID=A0A917M4V2_9BACL|nr:hypothetical protein [Paenibacillus radicis (ex Gao et al. 2016)]GGG78891.1 hypothetical protein GCM10010918_39850 [Paenibacillus radicis (ex Gao et al. 2016)]
MNKPKYLFAATALAALLIVSACGANNQSGTFNTPDTTQTQTDKPNTDTETAEPTDKPDKAGSGADEGDQEILIIIDQTPRPSEGNSFDFSVSKRPEGYALAEMQWVSDKSTVKNTIAEAIEHGGNGEDGFYISGNGQFMGFFYPDEMKGEEGQAIFIFKNEQGKELTWKKKITLN